MSKGTVVVVDDDVHLRALMCRWLARAGYQVQGHESGEACLDAMNQVLADAVVLDLQMPGLGGLETLDRLRACWPDLPVLILTSDDEVGTVVDAMQRGATDYMTKPVERTRLLTAVGNAVDRIRMALRLRSLEREAEGRGYAGLIGASDAMRRLFRELDRVAPADITTLIRGESGTGKELVARAIHDHSVRAGRAFVAVNCAAIPTNLQESELFGHEAGAFTGATGRRIGRFEQADGGTLFLDEVAELAPELQAKLLRAIQERSFFRVGGNREIRSDFRLVCASHRDLHAMVQAGEFREDLFYRIAVYELRLPPLRARGDDVLRLARRFLSLAAERVGQPMPTLTPEAADVLRGYAWPGNVRELLNAMERAALLAVEGRVARADLPPRILERAAEPGLEIHDTPGPAALTPPEAAPVMTLAELERQAIEAAVSRHEGNLTEVVRELGIGRTTLYRKLKQYRGEA